MVVLHLSLRLQLRFPQQLALLPFTHERERAEQWCCRYLIDALDSSVLVLPLHLKLVQN